LQTVKSHRKSAARNYKVRSLDLSGLNLKAAQEKIYAVVAHVAKAKLDLNQPSTNNFLISVEADSRGSILEVELLVNERTPLRVQDFEAMEKAILTSVKIPITKPELYREKKYLTFKFPIQVDRLPR
jgi:hypothetical protein